MIVDVTSALAAMTAVESIILSKKSRSKLRLNVVANGNEEADGFTKNFSKSMSCFEDFRADMVNVVYFRTDELVPADLQDECQGMKHICARFYVPSMFPHLKRYIYLDNDVIVTCDIKELWVSDFVRLAAFEEHPSMPSDKGKMRQSHHHRAHDGDNIDGFQVDKSSLRPIFRYKASKSRGDKHRGRRLSTDTLPGVSFVWEHHPMYAVYMQGNFNTSHPLVAATIERRDKNLFFNAGVALVNAGSWRRRNMTATFERLLRDNVAENMFNFARAGDQAVFYVMNDEDLGVLPHARFNMRRLPKKTLQLVGAGVSGVIHWAGTTGVDMEHLCLNPKQYPLIYDTGAISAFMKVVKSLSKRCSSGSLFTYSSECLQNTQ